jgi:hypothetical protein
MRILKNITFNETEMAISINIRSLPKKAIMFITSIKITEIIENAPNANDINIADINDINTILENIENASFKNITIEPASIRRSMRYRKAIFKIMEANIMGINIMEINIMEINIIGIAEAFIISTDKKESEKENYLSKIIIAKSIIANKNKLTYEKAMANLKKF